MNRPLWALLLTFLTNLSSAWAAVQVSPPAVRLDNPEASHQLLVTLSASGQVVDGTRNAIYEIANPAIAAVDATGLVTPRAEGRTEVRVRHGGEMVRIPVEVVELNQPRAISFEQQIIPILTKASCNSGGCHGKAEGQNGFKLSVFGHSPETDFAALVKESRGRRLFHEAPEQSLLLLKASAQVPHGGGRKIEKNDLRYRRILRWLREGARFNSATMPVVVSLEVEPVQCVLNAGGTQQLRVTAVDADGQRRCVTTEAEYDSNAGTIAGVDRRGLIQAGDRPGEAGILVRYLGHVSVCRVTLPRPDVRFARPTEANFIDRHVWNKLERLGIPPSEPADDAAFLRRVYLDTIGTLPTSAEARAFLASAEATKRARLVDQLLQRPEYADYWTLRWSDILRLDKDSVTPQGAVAVSRWLRRQFAENRPYDQFVRDILTVQGSTTAEGPAAVYKALNTPEVMSRSFSQVFLGVRIECAQCHHHPSEKWGQDDYFALAGLFAGVTRKPLPGGVEAIVSRGGNDLVIPRTTRKIPARALGAEPVELGPTADRRQVLADWMTAPANPYFAAAIANRLWAHYFGRGLIEPLDDLRATNPASNEPLLADLAKHLRDLRYDLKAFTRTLLLSNAYQLSSRPNSSNAADEQNFSHAAIKALPAEVLLDAICQATGVPEKFNGWPDGYRAIQVWDNRMPSYFFRIFGRPVRYSVCECERGTEPSIAQALHLMNSPEITAKIRARHGAVRKLADSNQAPEAIVEELFLATLSRLPSEKERPQMLALFQEDGRRGAVEDVLWALLNTKEFLYNH